MAEREKDATDHDDDRAAAEGIATAVDRPVTGTTEGVTRGSYEADDGPSH